MKKRMTSAARAELAGAIRARYIAPRPKCHRLLQPSTGRGMAWSYLRLALSNGSATGSLS